MVVGKAAELSCMDVEALTPVELGLADLKAGIHLSIAEMPLVFS